MPSSGTPKKLLMILEKPSGSEGFWLLDETDGTVVDIANQAAIAPLVNNNMMVFLDAKFFLQKWAIKPQPEATIICLSTIKHLIAKNFHEPINVPEFSSTDEALRWSKEATAHAFSRLNRLNLAQLANLECQVILATIAMEEKGLPFNKSGWQSALAHIEQETKLLKEQLNAVLKKSDGFLLFGPEPIDLNNPHAVKASLEEVLGQKLSGTSQSSLKDIDHEAVKLLLKYRENARMLSTYGHAFLSKIVDDRLRGHFVPIGSASGRFACHEPNLLALPNHHLFQDCLKPISKNQLLRFDYGGFELRILASLSQDAALLKVFNDKLDIHNMVGSAVFNTEVSKTHNAHLREQAKVLNFGIIYGMGEHALAKQLKISVAKASELLENYFKRFSRVHAFLKSLEAQAKNWGYITTALGRRAYFSSDVYRDQGYLARVARNIPIQGTGADIVKLAMCKVYKRLPPNAYLVNVVHDELVIECHKNDVDQISSIVKTEMANAFLSILPNVAPDISVKS